MAERVAVRVEAVLGGSWRSAVVADTPKLWYRFAEQAGSATLYDETGNGYTGTVNGGVTLEVAPLSPEGGFSATFNGSTGYVSIAGSPATGTAFTLEAVLKVSSIGSPVVIVAGASGAPLWGIDATGKPYFQNSATTVYTATAALTVGAVVHLAVTISAAGAGTHYLNGATNGTFTAAATWSFTPALFAKYSAGAFLPATVDEAAVYTSVLSGARILAHYQALAWTDLSDDLVSEEAIELGWGIKGNGPTDRIPDEGPAAFALNNSATNSAGLLGYYAPGHVNCRAGFAIGALVRVVFTWGGTDYVRFLGRITRIKPEPGRMNSRRTFVSLSDLSKDLIDADLRAVALQIGQTESTLVQSLVRAIPAQSRPLAVKTDAGLDTIAYCFDDIEDGTKAIGPLADLLNSVVGFGYVDAQGRLRYENRQARQGSSARFAFDNEMVGLDLPSDLERVYNVIRATYYPREVDAAATSVVWSARGEVLEIAPGATVDVWGDYFDASNPDQKIGATAQVTPAATTDYVANTARDGSGVDKTAQVVVTASTFASTVKWSIKNNDAATVYMTKLQLRGKRLLRYAGLTVESSSTQAYGVRPFNIEMRYQGDRNKAQALADYIRAQYETYGTRPDAVQLVGNESATHMLAALDAQPGDRVTLKEDATGTSADVFVQRVRVRVDRNKLVTLTLEVSGAAYFGTVWKMDDAALSLMDSTTSLGFA